MSIVQLIATPERFDGKLVSVVGFLRLEHLIRLSTAQSQATFGANCWDQSLDYAELFTFRSRAYPLEPIRQRLILERSRCAEANAAHLPTWSIISELQHN